MAVEVRDVRKSFGGLQALRGITLRLESESIVGLIGPNGSGKTTLVNIISGSLRPDSGSVSLDGTEVGGRPAHEVAKAGISRTFQNIRLFGGLTVLENVAVGATADAQRKESVLTRAEATLAALGLQSMGSRRASTLPYGVQRRVELARALAARPSYLLLDEPAAGMNEAESDELLQTIGGVREEHGLGVLVIDHDLRLIMRLCERVVVLNEGARIAEAPPSQVQRDPAVAEAYLGRRAVREAS